MENDEGTGPRLVVGAGYALYRGPLADSHAHRHAAFQVAFASGAAEPVPTVTATDGDGVRHRGAALVVAPMVRHRMAPVRELVTYFVDPHCAFADRLRSPGGPGITVAPQWRGLREEQVRPAGALPSARVDPRLRAAMEAAGDDALPLAGLAAQVGLSPQRLRALAQEQLGLPLARWRIWRRLARAADALRAGSTPAEAALLGGFADQAHFGRRMREMTGLTPAAVLPALRPALLPALRPALRPVGGQDRLAT
ncbi:helix-turn-helix domain-containing protein [Kitasatospora purpeofusca]|uniref:helix-turn-helix domain-containing protein n=1 Tax=Kitasatospora purpeofusca TaxID=67352 RepID=UPI00068E5A38|nr:AraC family transcriptional regulator [Kitasatospora purpeofusca]